jgi:hypothetical protein
MEIKTGAAQQDFPYPAARFDEKGCLQVWGGDIPISNSPLLPLNLRCLSKEKGLPSGHSCFWCLSYISAWVVLLATPRVNWCRFCAFVHDDRIYVWENMLVLHGQPTLKHGISGQQCSLFVVEWQSHKLFNTLCVTWSLLWMLI